MFVRCSGESLVWCSLISVHVLTMYTFVVNINPQVEWLMHRMLQTLLPKGNTIPESRKEAKTLLNESMLRCLKKYSFWQTNGGVLA